MAQVQALVLGSNGWYDTPAGNTTSLLIKTDRFSIVLDAGLGISRLEKYCDQSLPTYLFISHPHLDHIYGINVLMKFNFSAGLTIFGQSGIKSELQQIFKYPFSVEFEKYPYDVKVFEAPFKTEDFPFRFTVEPLRHAVPTIGIRIELEGKVISYVADTGYCQNCVKLAKGADLLFTECAHPIGQPEVGDWPHLSPENGAKIAKEAGAKQLVLMHFNPTHYPDAASRKVAETVAKQDFENTRVGFDGLEISL